jgi:general secretion pathway protein G
MRSYPKTAISKTGFTLMEIMIVIAILGILATLVMGAYLASMKKGRDIRRKADLSQLTKAMDMYNADLGNFPVSDNGLIRGCGDTASPPLTDCQWGKPWTLKVNGTDMQYEAQLPQDPVSGHKYYYSSSDGTYFQLYAVLENTQDPDVTNNNSMTYTGTACTNAAPIKECNFGIASTNALPATNHVLH